MISPQELQARIDRLPRVPLAHLPTPLEELPRLSSALGGPRIFIKRDDCTGLAFGGNKARHNEFILGRALEEGADTLVWGAGIQSNNCRQTAAAAAKLGLECHLVLTTDHAEMEFQGNFLLDHLVGARIELNSEPMGPPLWNKIEEKADSLRSEGRNVSTIADPASRAAAAVSYTLALLEIREQLDEQGVRADAVYFSSGGSTGAGMFLGRKLLGWEAALEAIMPIEWPFDTASYNGETGQRRGRNAGTRAGRDAGGHSGEPRLHRRRIRHRHPRKPGGHFPVGPAGGDHSGSRLYGQSHGGSSWRTSGGAAG